MIRVFVSHSHSDSKIVVSLVEYLLAGLTLKDSHIRCTSVAGHDLPSGTNIESELKKDLQNDIALIGLLTKNGLRSQWVLFELGAAWGREKLVIPILGPGVKYKDLPGPLAIYMPISTEDENFSYKLNGMISELSKNLNGVNERSGNRIERKRNEFINQLNDLKIQEMEKNIQEMEKNLQQQEIIKNLKQDIQQQKEQYELKKTQWEKTFEHLTNQLETQFIFAKTNNNKDIKRIKIYLASSMELKEDREKFRNFIRSKNREYLKQNIYLELLTWENLPSHMSLTRLQDEYNKVIINCDIFVSLFGTFVGQYTEEEFMKAFENFITNEKPFIYTYFKNSLVNISKISADKIASLSNFKHKLNDLGHLYDVYDNFEQLESHFDKQLHYLISRLINREDDPKVD